VSQAANQAAPDRQTTREAFLAAKDRQALGDLDEAKRRYGQILLKIPHHAESLTMLGSIAFQQGDDVQAGAYLDRAIEIYQAVIEQMPGLVGVRAPLVNLLLARGRQGEAEHLMAGLELGFNPVRSTAEEFLSRQRAGIGRGLPAMLINTVPKSASESIWNKLAEGLGAAQAHLSLGLFPDCCVIPFRAEASAQGGIIAKEHLLPTAHNLGVLAAHGIERIVCHQRDPRQATLSWAHFVRDDVSMRLMGPIWRKIVPPLSVPRDDLSRQIDWCIEHYLPLLIDFARDWARVSDDPAQPLQVLFLSFEAFHREPAGYYDRVLDFYGIDQGLFAGEAEAEVVHLRKGQLEEWRQVLTPAQQKKAWNAMPRELAERFAWQP
jgi:hypothetical protein